MKEKILLLTGASSEIGMHLIKTVGDEYTAVLAHYCSSIDPLLDIQKQLKCRIIPLQADFGDENSVYDMIRQIRDIGIPDHIIHIAAPKANNLQFHKYQWCDYENGIHTSLRSIVLLLESFIPVMQKKRYGRIIFILTSYILGGAAPKYQSPYITVKYALYGLMRNLASEYAGRGITVNGVSPDMMETKFLSKIEPMIIRQNAEKNPLKRNIAVRDVIPAIKYLLSDDAEAVTGQNIGVTGGEMN